MENVNHLSLVDSSIADLQSALTTGSITCVELVSRLLRRISVYDCRGVSLNSIPIINPDVFLEASASDERRVNGQLLGPLDGIPYTVKDSYKVKGMTVASGSPAFQDLVANEDAFTVAKLRAAGAVLIGRTNMPPMAAGGMQRGVYGRAESPYNLDYLAAAFASGSSNGSGVATAASFAAFGMGEETVSSGRSPASNNALVAYTPSRRAISIRGNWPLYPTCDVVVPHTRSMNDMLMVLDHITIRDNITNGDFWRGLVHETYEIHDPWDKQIEPLRNTSESASLKGVHIAVPAEYIGGDQSSCVDPVYTSPSVVTIWDQARTDLERLGAIVTVVPSFVAVEKYEALTSTSDLNRTSNESRLPENWHTTERSTLVAHAWEEFLNCNGAAEISSLKNIQLDQINPAFPPDDPQIRYSEPSNRIQYENLVRILNERSQKTEDGRSENLGIYNTPQLNDAIDNLTKLRKMYFEDWLDENNFDCVAFPAAGDVAAADADCNYASAEHAWRNGVKYSNGNRALRHLGIPSITVPMGMIQEKQMPIGLTFCGKAGDDISLLRWGAAYEAATQRRTVPPLTPPLDTDSVILLSDPVTVRSNPPEISAAPTQIRDIGNEKLLVNIRGTLRAHCIDLNEDPHTVDRRTGREIPGHEFPLMDIFVDGQKAPAESICGRVLAGCQQDMFSHSFFCEMTIPKPPARSERDKVASKRPIARDCVMVVMLARSKPEGRPAGLLELIPLLDSDVGTH